LYFMRLQTPIFIQLETPAHLSQLSDPNISLPPSQAHRGVSYRVKGWGLSFLRIVSPSHLSRVELFGWRAFHST
jgi:hypothetical protein